MEDRNVENACQMTDGKSEHSYFPLGVIQFYHPVSHYHLSAAARCYCHSAASHNTSLSPSMSNFFASLNNGSSNQSQQADTVSQSMSNFFASLNNGSSNQPQQAVPVATGVIANPQFLQYTQTCIGPSPNEQSLQQQPEFLYNNYIGQPFQPSSSGSVQQHGNYSRGGGFCNWIYTNPLGYVNGIYSESGAQESMNAHMQEYKTAWAYGNPAFGLPFPNQNQHLPYVQSMQVLSHNQNVQTVAPAYFFPVSNLQATDANISQIAQVASIAPPYPLSVSNVQTINAHTSDSANRSPGPSQLIAEEIYLSHQPEAEEEEYEDDDESFYDSDSDPIPLDTEDLSYEELLALEEQMGDVNTGLSEDSILKNLKLSVCAPLSLTLAHSSVSLLNERCAVCLVEYEEDERIGSLDCGHSYHADCIKEWLLIKNVCPMCRTCGLASGRKE